MFSLVAVWCPLGSNLCKHAVGHSRTTEACTSPHLIYRGLCGMGVWKLIGAICAMVNRFRFYIHRQLCSTAATICLIWMEVIWSSKYYYKMQTSPSENRNRDLCLKHCATCFPIKYSMYCLAAILAQGICCMCVCMCMFVCIDVQVTTFELINLQFYLINALAFNSSLFVSRATQIKQSRLCLPVASLVRWITFSMD